MCVCQMFHSYVNTTYISTENIWFSLYVEEMISSSYKHIANKKKTRKRSLILY